MRWVVLAGLAAVACGHHTAAPVPPAAGTDAPAAIAPPPPPDAAPVPDAPVPLAQDSKLLAERIVAVIEDLAAATGAGDCAAISSAVTELRTRDAEVLDAAHKAD